MLTPPRCAGMSEIACICFSIRAVIGIHFSERPTSGSSTNDKFRAIHDLFGQKYLSLAGLTRNNLRNARCDHPSETLALMPSAPRRKRTARTDRLRHCAILLTGSYPAQSNSRASSSAVQGRKAGRELRLGDSQGGGLLGGDPLSLIPVIPFYAEIQGMRETIETPARDRIPL